MDIKALCEKLLSKENMNMVYRIKAEHLMKDTGDQLPVE